MKPIKVILIVLLIFATVIASGCGKVMPNPGTSPDAVGLASSELKKVVLNSKLLEKDMKLNIYLPKGYSNKNKYPVLYMLHGYGGNEETWMPGVNLDKKADELIDSNKIKPLIIVCPEIDNSWGINSSEKPLQIGNAPSNSLNEGMYEDYICKEIVTYIDSSYSTIASRDGRYIGGLSMGGFASLRIAFTHTDLYSKVGGHSPALWLNDVPTDLSKWLYPTDSIRKQRDPIYLAQDRDLKLLKVYLDCGDKDVYKFYEGCDNLYKILQSKGVNVQYHLNPGEHDAAYWESNTEKYLLFYDGK